MKSPQQIAFDIGAAVAHRVSLESCGSDERQAMAGPVCGLALLCAALQRLPGGERFHEIGQMAYGLLIDSVCTKTYHSSGMYGGLAGVGWVLDLLKDHYLADPSEIEDLLSQIDGAIILGLEGKQSRDGYDLISGTVGLGVYGLYRHKHDAGSTIVSLVVDALAETSQTDGRRIWWITPPELIVRPEEREDFPNGQTNLGMAHGVPGVASLLALALARGHDTPRTRSLLAGTVDYLVSMEQHQNSVSRYSYVAERTGNSRLAWCYGDVGVSLAILQSATALGDEDRVNWASALLLNAAARTSANGIQDAGICHGSAGILHVVRRAQALTDHPGLAAPAAHWFGELVKVDETKHPHDIFQSWQGAENTYVTDHSFLTGATGVALALLSATDQVEFAWDAPLLTDIQGLRSNPRGAAAA